MSPKHQGMPRRDVSSQTQADADDASALNPAVQDHIGRYLRHLYDSIADEPVPDRFVELLAELERKQREPK